jgi:basic amino acid/polyamine antiporter, APA family
MAEAVVRSAQTDRDTPLKRAIGRNMLLLFVVGDVLGAGIYALVGEVAGRVGGAAWTSFMLALGLAVFTAFSYIELVTKYPHAGGAGLYANKAFRLPFLTFLVTFAVMMSGVTSAATLSRAFGGDYLSEFVDVETAIAGLLFIVVVAAVNARGIAESVRINVTLTVVEVIGLVLIVVIGVAAISAGDAEPSRAFEFKSGEAVPWAIVAGATLAFYALIGFEDSVNVSEESRDPRRDYPRALFGGLAIAGVIYFAVAMVASMAVETSKLSGSSGPLLEVVQVGPLAIDTRVFSAIALLAVANGALINMIMASRLLYGMARQRILPGGFARLLPGRRTPIAGIVFTTLIAAALILVGELETLADTTVLLLLLVFAVVNVAVLVLRRDAVEHDHFRAPTAIPVIGVAVIVLLLTQTEARIFGWAAALLGIGVVLYALNWLLGGGRGPRDPMETGEFRVG